MSARGRDWVRQWGRVGDEYKISGRELYTSHVRWCVDTGRQPLPFSTLSEYLLERGLAKVRERAGVERTLFFAGTLLEEESDVLDGVGQASDRARERERGASIEIVGVDVGVVFEVGHCVIRVPTSLYSRLGRVLQILAHDGEPTDPGVS